MIRSSVSSCRRGFVLVAVLVVITSSILIATSLLFLAQSRLADTATAADAAQSRALAMSAVQAVMSRLNDQRDRILQGELPRLEQQYTIYEATRRHGVARLVPVTSSRVQLLVPEAGKADLNSVDADALAKTGMIDPAAATAIITHRSQQSASRFQSTADLLHAPEAGITPEKLYGPIEEIRPADLAQTTQGDLAERVADRLQAPAARCLNDVLTVFSIEPQLQASGRLRINLNTQWTEALDKQVEERFGENAAAQLEGLYERGVTFGSMASIVKLLREAQVPERNWRDIFDAFTTHPDDYVFGRIDVNTASPEALLTLPGISAELAAQIVAQRERLTPEERATVVWPVLAQIITAEQFEQIVDRITTRCWVYRVHIAAGEVDADQPQGVLVNPVMLDVVIDLSSPQPRIAYMRDISVLQAAAQIALQASPTNAARAPEVAESQPRVPLDPATPAPADVNEAAGGPLANGTSNPPAAPQPQAKPDDAQQPSAPPAAPARKKIGRWIGG